MSVSGLKLMDLSGVSHITEGSHTKFLFRELLNMQDFVSFEGIVLDARPENTSDKSRIYVKLRDTEANDCINLFVEFKPASEVHVALVNSLVAFCRVSVTKACRVVSQSLSIYCKVRLDSTASNLSVIQEHTLPCHEQNCPCHYLQNKCLNSHSVTFNGTHYNLPIVHLRVFPETNFLLQIDQRVLFRLIFRLNCIVTQVHYLHLEYLCFQCKRASLDAQLCRVCNSPEVNFNLKATVSIDDGSLIAFAKTESLELTKTLLQLSSAQVRLLETMLQNSDQFSIALRKEQLHDDLRMHFEQLEPCLHQVAVKVFACGGDKADHFISYIVELNRNSYIAINSTGTDKAYMPSVKILSIV